MRGGDHVRDAVFRSGAAHGDAGLPRFWAVVNFGKDMGVDVDHAGRHYQKRN
jgi:phytoene/squalene synthetase